MDHYEGNTAPRQSAASVTEVSERSPALELAKFKAVEQANTVEELYRAAISIGKIDKNFNVDLVTRMINAVYNFGEPYSKVTNFYGFQAKLMCIMYYEGKIHLL